MMMKMKKAMRMMTKASRLSSLEKLNERRFRMTPTSVKAMHAHIIPVGLNNCRTITSLALHSSCL